jgi:hypothetical protein
MLSWVTAPPSTSQSISIFWLTGLAGTGKSTIAKTFCQRIGSNNSFLLASFFASRGSAERRDPYAILHTLAYELATLSGLIRPHVLSAVRAPQHIMHQPMHDQMQLLLAEPIKRAQLRGRTVVLAIDALDECHKIAGVEGGPLVELLAQALWHQPVKLLVTSRQENSLFNMFCSLPHVSLRLQNIESVSVEADVWRILNAGFAYIRRKRARDLKDHDWPTNSDLNTLVALTGPLLIYAATVLRFVGDSRFLPDERLHQVLERGPVTPLDSSRPFLQIDNLYMDVLEAATVDENGRVDIELCQRVGVLLRTVVLLEQPVSVYALAHLMGVSANRGGHDGGFRSIWCRYGRRYVSSFCRISTAVSGVLGGRS